MKIINLETGHIKDISIQEIKLLTVNQLNKYGVGVGQNEYIASDETFLQLAVDKYLLENQGWVLYSDYIEDWPKFNWGDNPEHDFPYRVWVSDTDIKRLNKEYFDLIQSIKSDPENPSITIGNGELIYINSLTDEGRYILTNVLNREIENNPRLNETN